MTLDDRPPVPPQRCQQAHPSLIVVSGLVRKNPSWRSEPQVLPNRRWPLRHLSAPTTCGVCRRSRGSRLPIVRAAWRRRLFDVVPMPIPRDGSRGDDGAPSTPEEPASKTSWPRSRSSRSSHLPLTTTAGRDRARAVGPQDIVLRRWGRSRNVAVYRHVGFAVRRVWREQPARPAVRRRRPRPPTAHLLRTRSTPICRAWADLCSAPRPSRHLHGAPNGR